MVERVKGELAAAMLEAGVYAKSAFAKKMSASDVDRRVRDKVCRKIRAIDPRISFYGEEREPDRFLIVSGIDSAENFSKGLGEYGIMSSVYEEGVPTYGVIYYPQSELVITAEEGKGTRINGRRIKVSEVSELSKAVLGCTFNIYSSDMEPLGIDLLERIARMVPGWRNGGSPAWDFLLVSDGTIDAFVAGCSETCHGAGYLAMKEAGAIVTDRKGRPFSVGSGEVIAANPVLHDALLEVLNE